MKIKLMITGIAFFALTSLAFGQNSVRGQRAQNNNLRYANYADTNKNGICDNYENRSANFSPGRGQNLGRGPNCGRRQGRYSGKGNGQSYSGQGYNRVRYFVDANKNGVCDFREKPEAK